MGFNFRKSFKIAPGIRVNVSKKGISSVSIGGKGASVSLGKKGARSTISAPGTGLSYSTQHKYSSDQQQHSDHSPNVRATGFGKLFLIGFVVVFLMIWILG